MKPTLGSIIGSVESAASESRLWLISRKPTLIGSLEAAFQTGVAQVFSPTLDPTSSDPSGEAACRVSQPFCMGVFVCGYR